jgi:hypothetical protein
MRGEICEDCILLEVCERERHYPPTNKQCCCKISIDTYEKEYLEQKEKDKK